MFLLDIACIFDGINPPQCFRRCGGLFLFVFNQPIVNKKILVYAYAANTASANVLL